jgi:hypothetical protein
MDGEVRTRGAGRDGAGSPARAPAAHDRRPNLSGDLALMLQEPPAFRRSPLGYDRLQVENYVRWAEDELAAGSRERDDLVLRCARLRSDLDEARRLLHHSPAGRESIRLSWRIGSVLSAAADQAEAITAQAEEDAERTRAEARAEAEERLAKVAERERRAAEHERRAVELAERLREEAAEDRQRADAEAAAARRRADEQAAALREQLDRVAEGRRTAQLVEVQELEGRCAQARRELERIADQVVAALASLLEEQPEAVPPPRAPQVDVPA